MTPLEAARELLNDVDLKQAYECVACGADHAPHELTCPWLAMPKIVAALEKVKIILNPGAFTQDDDGICFECGGVVMSDCRPKICDTAALRELMGIRGAK